MPVFLSRPGRSAAVTLAISLCCAGPLHAADDEAPSALKLSGFLSLVGGRVSGDLGADYLGPDAIDGHPCPCYIADWGNA
ncbi:hypothetical protein LP419_15965 [Massilia sp. H-1]|nr:hypothetical protein LP419_15965 [Massilia sp. H-1]